MMEFHRCSLYRPTSTLDRCASVISCVQKSAGWYSGTHDSDSRTNMVLLGSSSAARSSLRCAATSDGCAKPPWILQARQNLLHS